MKKGFTYSVIKWFFRGAVALLTVGAVPGHAQTARVPIPLEQLTVMVDQFSVPLSGKEGDLVHVLAVGSEPGALPPNPDTGEPNPTNRILFTTRVGAGIFNPQDADGRFVTAINPRP